MLRAPYRKQSCSASPHHSRMLIGERVAELMAENDWSFAEVARRVQAEGARNVRYQHIQQLVEHPTRRPGFLVELAAAFGMTAEQFMGRKPALHIHGKDGVNVAGSVSQPARNDWQKMRDAQELLRHLGEIRGVPALEHNPKALTIAYEFLLEYNTPLDAANALDLTKRLNDKLKGEGDASGARGDESEPA